MTTKKPKRTRAVLSLDVQPLASKVLTTLVAGDPLDAETLQALAALDKKQHQKVLETAAALMLAKPEQYTGILTRTLDRMTKGSEA